MSYIPNSIEARDVATLVHMQTNLRKHQLEGPHVIMRGQGCRVFDDAGRLVAALSLSTPADRMKVHWGPLVKETADRISGTIGHRPTSRIGAA